MIFRIKTTPLKRSKNESVIHRSVYITGRTLYDSRTGKYIPNHRTDVVWHEIFLPNNAPPGYEDLQTLAEAMESAEKRCNSRTARQYILNLPNTLPQITQIELIRKFIKENFVSRDLCVIAAIHDGKNNQDSRKNNPHVHILVSTRPINGQQFDKHKDRVLDSKEHLETLRLHWAEAQNHEFERFKLPYRVTAEKERPEEREHIHDSPERSR